MIVIWTLLLGCGRGSLHWDDGRDVLRTALVGTSPAGGVQQLTVVLSNSTFACDLPTDPDPFVQTQALLDLSTAACREGAEHVLIDLWRGDGEDWTGVYPGVPDAGPNSVVDGATHVMDASWYGIDEAAIAGSEDFVRTYGVTLDGTHRFDAMSAGGEVNITSGDGTTGRFEFPETGLHGRFTGEVCPPGSTLFTLLASSAVAACPVVGF